MKLDEEDWAMLQQLAMSDTNDTAYLAAAVCDLREMIRENQRTMALRLTEAGERMDPDY